MFRLNFPWYPLPVTFISWCSSLKMPKFDGKKSWDENEKSSSLVTFWHPLADMLSAHYPRVHYCYMLYKCQENSWQLALMLSVLLTQSVFFLTSLSSNSAWISGPKKHLPYFWWRNLFIKCWNELHFLSILTIVRYFQCQGYYLISHRN